MSTTKLAAVSGLVLLLAALNAAGVESQIVRRPSFPRPQVGDCHWSSNGLGIPVWICDGANPTTPENPPPPAPTFPSMFVFGDSFVDNGNLPSDPQNPSPIIRQWYLPYGDSYAKDDGSAAAQGHPTGRFSNYLVQSDFIGKILGFDEAPPPYLSTGRNGNCDSAGMTFAAGGSGVYPVPVGAPTLSDQLDNFERLVNSGCITRAQLDVSLALVAVSGNDYDRVGVAQPSGFGDVTAFTKNVTSQIAAAVDRLERVGVNKILVNNLPPVGCAPAQTLTTTYATCDGAGNAAAKSHNDNLKQLLADKANVLVLDLFSAFTRIVDSKGSDLSRQFYNKKTPCCVGTLPNGLCGDMGGDMQNPVVQHTVCDSPEKHFYWDEMNPTQAGWTAVMTQLQDPIKQFIWPKDS